MRSSFWITCLLFIGCLGNEGGPPEVSPSGADIQNDTTAVAVLALAKRTQIDVAAGRLRGYEYVRERAVSVTDESGRTILEQAHATRFYGPSDRRSAAVLDSASFGPEDEDFWADYTGAPSREDTLEWSRRLLEEDPLLLSRQGFAYYRYSVLSDTTIGGAPVIRISVDPLPGSERPGIQSGRFYIERETDELVGFELEFVQRSLLFDEESRFRYMLDRAPDGHWLPREVKISTFLNLPLTKGQYFDLHVRYITR